MKQEKSCGAVIFKKDEDNKNLFLIEKMSLGHNSMCKGHVENDETELETAAREIKEETSLDVRFIDGFRETIGYSPFEGIYKTVVYFLAVPVSDMETKDEHDDEVASSCFLPYDEALESLTYKSDKEVLIKANDFIRSNNL